MWRIGVEYIPAGTLSGGDVRRSVLREVASACGRELSERIGSWPTAAHIGDPYVDSEGAYLPTLAGEVIRDANGYAIRLPSVAEAAYFAERLLLAVPLENVWICTDVVRVRMDDPAAWTVGIAGPSLGWCEQRGMRRLVAAGLDGVTGRACTEAAIRPRLLAGTSTKEAS
jgi:hypothetical protein